MLKFKSVAPVWCAMMTNARYYEIRPNVCTSPHRTPQICKYGAVSIVTPGRLSFLSASLCRIVAAGVVAVKRRRGAGFVLSPRLLVRTWPIGAKFIVSTHQTRYLSHRASLTIERSTTGCSKLRSLTLPVPTNSVVKACTTCWFSMQYASISWTISFTTQVRLYRTGYWPALHSGCGGRRAGRSSGGEKKVLRSGRAGKKELLMGVSSVQQAASNVDMLLLKYISRFKYLNWDFTILDVILELFCRSDSWIYA